VVAEPGDKDHAWRGVVVVHEELHYPVHVGRGEAVPVHDERAVRLRSCLPPEKIEDDRRVPRVSFRGGVPREKSRQPLDHCCFIGVFYR
jgi:hypothetical protein